MSSSQAAALRGPRPLRAFVISLAVSALVLAFLLLSDRRVLELRRARADIQRLEVDLAEQKREQEALRAALAAAEKHAFPAEKVAREELHLVDPGDLVLLFPPGSLTTAAPSPATAPASAPTPAPR